MPVGIVVNVISFVVGTLIGGAIRRFVPDHLRENLPKIFGICAFTIGVQATGKVQTLPMVIVAVILGFTIGELLRIDRKVVGAFSAALKKLPFRIEGDREAYMEQYLLAVLMFAMSGTSVFGALNEGLSGDPAILLSKSMLDLCSAVLFGAILGYAQVLICVPQVVVLVACYLAASVIAPFLSPVMIADFQACGGLLTMLTGLTVSRVLKLRAINLVPALILVMPLVGLYHMVF